MALDGLLGEVTHARVQAHLHERQPDVLEEDVPEQVALFEALVKGAAVRVTLMTGPEPQDQQLRNLAVEAIALEAASIVEYASYPEQQAPGNEGRGYHLHQRFLELLGVISSLVVAGGGVVPGGAQAPLGDFPPPLPEILPEESYYVAPRWYW